MLFYIVDIPGISPLFGEGPPDAPAEQVSGGPKGATDM